MIQKCIITKQYKDRRAGPIIIFKNDLKTEGGCMVGMEHCSHLLFEKTIGYFYETILDFFLLARDQTVSH